MKSIWRRDQEDVERAVVSSAFANLTESIIDTHTAVKVLAVTVTAEIMGFVMLYVSKDKVQDFLDDPANGGFWVYASIAVYLIGFLTAFASYRLLTGGLPHLFPKYMLLPIAIIAGIANLGIFFVLVNFQLA